MTSAEIKLLRNYYESSKIPYCVVLDNEHLFWAGIEGHRLIWKDADQTCIAIKVNNKNNQAYKPLEIYTIVWDNIQGFKADIDKEQLKLFLSTAGIANTKINELVQYYTDLGYFNAQNCTPSGGEVDNKDEKPNGETKF